MCPKSYGFSSRTPNEPYFKFPPIIGRTRNAAILFIGINPRISSTNSSLHEALMLNKSNFLNFSANKFCGQSYIENELHYRFHVRLIKKLFGKHCQFEDVAAVTEIFLCATETTRSLPASGSPCSDLYLGEVIRLSNPQVIVAVGKRVVDYFKMSPNKQWGWSHSVLKFDGRDIPFVDISHPANRELSESQKNIQLLKVARNLRGWF